MSSRIGTIAVIFGLTTSFMNCSNTTIQTSEATVGVTSDVVEEITNDELVIPMPEIPNEAAVNAQNAQAQCRAARAENAGKELPAGSSFTNENGISLVNGTSLEAVKNKQGILILAASNLKSVSSSYGVTLIYKKGADPVQIESVKHNGGVLITCGFSIQSLESDNGISVIVEGNVEEVSNGFGVISVVNGDVQTVNSNYGIVAVLGGKILGNTVNVLPGIISAR